MKISGIIFDINGTLVDIHTDEGDEMVYRAVSHFLTYQGIHMHRGEVKEEYFQIMDEQRKAGGEAHPEFDSVALWREFLFRRSDLTAHLPKAKLAAMPLFLSEMYRGVSRHHLQPYPGVVDTLEELRGHYYLAILSDAQSAWARPELQAVALDKYFDHIIISGDYGYRKPDRRLFEGALAGLDLPAEEVVMVGNDIYHDVFGAKQLGIKTVIFHSNQGRKHMEGVEADYIIYHFGELRQAVAFLEEH